MHEFRTVDGWPLCFALKQRALSYVDPALDSAGTVGRNGLPN
jgi:hypothetical protein